MSHYIGLSTVPLVPHACQVNLPFKHSALADAQLALGRFLKALQRLADEFGVAVVVTNQVCTHVPFHYQNASRLMLYFQMPMYDLLGSSWAKINLPVWFPSDVIVMNDGRWYGKIVSRPLRT